ncbi:MAG: hypothetical protein ACT4PT_08175 [Methanobacteriota archaeon]
MSQAIGTLIIPSSTSVIEAGAKVVPGARLARIFIDMKAPNASGIRPDESFSLGPTNVKQILDHMNLHPELERTDIRKVQPSDAAREAYGDRPTSHAAAVVVYRALRSFLAGKLHEVTALGHEVAGGRRMPVNVFILNNLEGGTGTGVEMLLAAILQDLARENNVDVRIMVASIAPRKARGDNAVKPQAAGFATALERDLLRARLADGPVTDLPLPRDLLPLSKPPVDAYYLLSTSRSDGMALTHEALMEAEAAFLRVVARPEIAELFRSALANVDGAKLEWVEDKDGCKHPAIWGSWGYVGYDLGRTRTAKAAAAWEAARGVRLAWLTAAELPAGVMGAVQTAVGRVHRVADEVRIPPPSLASCGDAGPGRVVHAVAETLRGFEQHVADELNRLDANATAAGEEATRALWAETGRLLMMRGGLSCVPAAMARWSEALSVENAAATGRVAKVRRRRSELERAEKDANAALLKASTKLLRRKAATTGALADLQRARLAIAQAELAERREGAVIRAFERLRDALDTWSSQAAARLEELQRIESGLIAEAETVFRDSSPARAMLVDRAHARAEYEANRIGDEDGLVRLILERCRIDLAGSVPAALGKAALEATAPSFASIERSDSRAWIAKYAGEPATFAERMKASAALMCPIDRELAPDAASATIWLMPPDLAWLRREVPSMQNAGPSPDADVAHVINLQHRLPKIAFPSLVEAEREYAEKKAKGAPLHVLLDVVEPVEGRLPGFGAAVGFGLVEVQGRGARTYVLRTSHGNRKLGGSWGEAVRAVQTDPETFEGVKAALVTARSGMGDAAAASKLVAFLAKGIDDVPTVARKDLATWVRAYLDSQLREALAALGESGGGVGAPAAPPPGPPPPAPPPATKTNGTGDRHLTPVGRKARPETA